MSGNVELKAGTSSWTAGVRKGLPLFVPTFLLAVSFGVLAAPQLGGAAAVVMSALVWAGGAQFAALGMVQAGGTVAAATLAGLLVNTRFLLMGLAVAPSLRGGALQRAVEAQTLVDASFALSAKEGGRFDRGILLGSALPQYVGWTTGTLAGVLAGQSVHDIGRFGLDAVFPAFYLVLLLGELRERRAVAVAVLAAVVTLLLMPFAPPGLPVLAAAPAALLGLRRG